MYIGSEELDQIALEVIGKELDEYDFMTKEASDAFYWKLSGITSLRKALKRKMNDDQSRYEAEAMVYGNDHIEIIKDSSN